jgi:hypothetical protein
MIRRQAATDSLPVQPPAPITPASEIRMEVRRGSASILVTWPAALATECGTWLREFRFSKRHAFDVTTRACAPSAGAATDICKGVTPWPSLGGREGQIMLGKED